LANKSLFQGVANPEKVATTTNLAGGQAYRLSDEAALAQVVLTGMLTNTYYVSAKAQLDQVKTLAKKVGPEFLAQVAVYARENGFMKDMPALLMAILSTHNGTQPRLFANAFDRTLDNGKMIKNFVQIIRSNQVGRKSLGSLPKRLISDFLNERPVDRLLWDSIGGDVDMADLIQLTHPTPSTVTRAEVFKYLAGKKAFTEEELITLNVAGKSLEDISKTKEKYIPRALPESYQKYIAWLADPTQDLPKVPFQMLTSQTLTKEQWNSLALNASWQEIRQSLDTFTRHEVFANLETVQVLAEKLRDPALIAKAKVFPYQLLVTYMECAATIPAPIRDALHDALEIATSNIPDYGVDVVVCPDASGSMTWPASVVGNSKVVKAVHVAALVSASILRRNPTARVIPFGTDVIDLQRLNVIIDPKDTIMTNATKLGGLNGGGTRVAAPLRKLNAELSQCKLVVIISDNESWVRGEHTGNHTETMVEWDKFKARVPDAKLVLIDTCPGTSTQAKSRNDVLNVAGFNDNVFNIINKFVANQLDPGHLVAEIKKVVVR